MTYTFSYDMNGETCTDQYTCCPEEFQEVLKDLSAHGATDITVDDMTPD